LSHDRPRPGPVDGPARLTRLLVSATPPEPLLEGEGTGLIRPPEIDPAVPEDVPYVQVMAASCDDDPAVEYPARPVHQQERDVPVRLTQGGADRLPLVLAGPDG